jgi:transmembrane sensor
VHAKAARRRAQRRRVAWAVSLAAAAALALAAIRFSWRPAAPVVPAAALAATGPRVVTLADGTLVRVNAGGEIVEQFTAAERRVELTRGEAHFTVTQDTARPFVVVAGTLRVRAVGTAFNVNFQPAQTVEVLVTEGVVQLNSSTAPAAIARDPLPLLSPGQRALVALAPASPAAAVVITTASADEIAHALAWQAPLLRLGGATLAELVLEFQRSSGQRVILADPALASLRIGGRFRADDLAGFAHLLATSLDLETDRAADGTLVLRKKRPQTR